MDDKTTTLATLKKKMIEFVDERDWGQFHTPKNLSMAIAAEASELMEFFLWLDTKGALEELETSKEDIEHEIADIMSYLLAFCGRHNIDIAQAFEKKMRINALKYPVEKSKGRHTKYTNL